MIDISHYDKVLIAEDHELYRDGIKLLIEDTLKGARVYVATDYSETLSLLNKNVDITLLLLDIKMPGTQKLDGLKEIRNLYPTLTIVVISSLDFDISIRQMLDLGVNGFISKSTSKNNMQEAIIQVLAGNIVVKSEKDGLDFIDLSERQLQTLKCLSEGLSNKEIAERLEVSPLTAKEYVSQIISRLNVSNRTQAVLAAQKHGLVIEHLY